ncbi:hypothetical protein [Saccharopolyspora shandongensis]|uniref:hypothetical protein n=1 Tax=Saccharopolyspora shandongensis TaxID=418495 RepID=UPI0033CD00F9
MRRQLPANHPLSKIYRRGASILAVSLGVAGVLDYLLFSGTAWGAASAALGAVVVAFGACRGGHCASSACGATGLVLMIVSSSYLLLMAGQYNPAGVRPLELIIVLLISAALVIVASYGRISAGLGPENPFVQSRRRSSTQTALRKPNTWDDRLVRAEIAMAEGHPTPEQELMLMASGSVAHRARRQPSIAGPIDASRAKPSHGDGSLSPVEL